MKKSLLAFVLAFSLVLSVAVPAFAATPSDVVGKPEQSAVEELTALGIIQGYADGTFKPENSITRAELAKIIVIATGNENAAALMQKVKPAFKDVKSNVWYTGFINVAVTKGFVKGYNGNFRPSDNVKFEEVVAMLVRALGYQDKYLSGAWPYNVLLQADQIELFDGIDIAAGTLANRGTVAELASNTLGAKLVTYDVDGNRYFADTKGNIHATGQPLINKLGNSAVKVVTNVAVKNNEVDLNGTREDVAKSFFVTGGLKLADLLGHTVNVLYNKDGDVLAVTDAQNEKNIITAKSDAQANVTTAASVYINNGDAEYETAAGFFVFDNTDEQTSAYNLANDVEVEVYLNEDGEAQALLVNDWDSNIVLDEVVAYKDYSRVMPKFADPSFKVVSTSSITLNGEAVALTDLKENDIVNAIVNAAGDAITLEVTRNTVSGKLESVGTVGTDTTYKVAGTNYVAVDNGLGLTASDIGTEYTYYLNKDGKVAYYATAAAIDNTQFAVVYDVQTPVSIIDNGEVSSGWTKVVYFSLKDAKKVTAYTKDVHTTTALNETLVELKFDKDGRIDLTATPGAVDLTTATEVDAVTASKLTLVGSTNYILNSGTIYLSVDVNGANTAVTIKTAADLTKGDDVAVTANAGVAKVVAITSDGNAADLPAVNGLYINKGKVSTSATASTYSVDVNVKGEVKTYAIDGGAYDALASVAKFDLINLADDALAGNNDVYEDVTLLARTAASATLSVDAANNKVTVAGGTFLVTPDTQIFTTQDSYDSIALGSFADVRVAADGTNYGTAAGQYKVVVLDSGVNYGADNEAGVILVIAY